MNIFINDFNDGVQVSVDASDLEEFDQQEEQREIERSWKRVGTRNVAEEVNTSHESSDESATNMMINTLDETVTEPIDDDQQGSHLIPHQMTDGNKVIITKATRDWLAEQRRQDDIRFKNMMQSMLDERFNKPSSSAGNDE